MLRKYISDTTVQKWPSSSKPADNNVHPFL